MLALALGAVPGVAQGQYRHRVVLLEQPSSDEASVEVLARVRGELTAAGFEVVLLPGVVEGDPTVVSETTARELHPAAVLFVLERPAEGSEPRTIELWLSDRMARRTFVQRLPVEADDAGRGYKRLAVQAVELLKARFAELALTREPEPAKPPEHETPRPAPTPKPKPPGVSGHVAGGLAMLQGFDGVRASLLPMLRGGASIPAGSIGGAPFVVDVGGTVAALGSTTTFRAAPGEATVGQGLGMVGAGLRFDRGALLEPLVTVGAGVYSVDVEGLATGAGRAREHQTWSMLTAVGAGLWIQPTRAVAFELEGQLADAWSGTVVHIDGQRVAEAGSPLVLLSLAVVGLF